MADAEALYGLEAIAEATLASIERRLENAVHYRDAQVSEYHGAIAARSNGTDYYADEADFQNDLRRRKEAWLHWNNQIEKCEKLRFQFKLKHGEIQNV